MKTEPTLSLNERTAVRLPLIVLLSILAATATAVIAWARLGDVDSVNARAIEVHERRINKLEEGQADLAVIRNDVQWIRRSLEQQKRTP